MLHRIRPRYQARSSRVCRPLGCVALSGVSPSRVCRPLGCVALLGHGGGMKSISRRLSAATPLEPQANRNASQRDASMHRERCGARGPLAGIPSGCGSSGAHSGGVASLNHGCDVSGIGTVRLNDLSCSSPGPFRLLAGFDRVGNFLSKTARLRQSLQQWTRSNPATRPNR
jgi:hypothetical protein